MTGQTDAEIVEQVRMLISRLPGAAVRTLMDEMERRYAGDAPRRTAVRSVIVEHLNAKRPHRAQRLFMSLVEPLLVNDTVLLRAPQQIPGLLQRVDVAALWKVLSETGFPDLAREAQGHLDKLAKEHPVERVLGTPLALELRKRMRDAAVEHLELVLRDRKKAEQFLERLNAQALKDARGLAASIDDKPRLEATHLRTFADLLQFADVAVSTVDETLARFATPTSHPAEIEYQVSWCATAGRDIGEALPELVGSRAANLRALPLLSMCNALHRYQVVARYVGDRLEEMTPEATLAVEALLGHFAGCCGTIAALMTDVIDRANSESEGLLLVPAQMRAELDVALDRFGRVFDALMTSGLFDAGMLDSRYRFALTEASQILGGSLATFTVERARDIVFARMLAPPDTADVVWLVGFVYRWTQRISQLGLQADDLVEFQRNIRREVQSAFNAALKFEPHELMEERLAHVVRLNKVMMAMDRSVADYFTALSHNLQALMKWSLDRARMTQEELLVVNAYIALVQDQMGRSKHWVSPELKEVIETYERRLEAGFELDD